MNETQLQIVLSLIDEASGQLAEAQTALANLGQAGADAAAQITDALTPAEEAVVAQAQTAADAWSGAAGEIAQSFEEAVPTADAMLLDLGQANLEAATQVADAWRSQAQAMEDDLAAAMATMDEDTTAAADDMVQKVGGATSSMHGYFRNLIVGYALQQAGSFLSGGIESAVQAASQSGDQIATLTAQIQQQQASIAQNEAALQKWNGTTAQVSAAHQKAAADIAAEKEKIIELNQQLAVLVQAQQGLPGQITNVENAILGWIGAHQGLEASIQTLMTTLGPMLNWIAEALIGLTLLKLALSVLSGPLLILLAIAVAVAALSAIWAAFHTQIVGFFTDLNAQTGILDLFRQSWESISTNFETNLLPALDKLWIALQPLAPYLKAMAVVIGATLVGAIVLLVDTLTLAVNLFTDILTIATKVATFFTNVFVAALNSVERAIEAIITAAAKVGSVGGAIGGAISSGVGSVFNAIPKFADGGIVSSPTLALVGEAGPEAIIPLSAFAGGSSLHGSGPGSGGINVYIQGGTYLDQNGAKMIGDALARSVGMQLKLRNFF